MSYERGNNPFDINLRTIIAFREIGKGYAGLESFTELTFNNTIRGRT